ncbi:MAG: hypothetical protein M3P91_10605 [Actinomycetota bacterium]|nr:hypothetical protein [Actinomycetota bacterium]
MRVADTRELGHRRHAARNAAPRRDLDALTRVAIGQRWHGAHELCGGNGTLGGQTGAMRGEARDTERSAGGNTKRRNTERHSREGRRYRARD